jgi:hypothetical protein
MSHWSWHSTCSFSDWMLYQPIILH